MSCSDMKLVAYAVAKKGYWKILVAFRTKEEAERYVKGKEDYLEVREVYE